MTAQNADRQTWSRRHLLGVTILLLIGQLGMIVWLSRGTPGAPVSLARMPVAHYSSRSISLPAGVENPAAFVFPNASGFSGEAWLMVSNLTYEPPRWSDSTPIAKPTAFVPGDYLVDFLRTNAAPHFQFSTTPEPEQPALPLDNLPDGPSYLTVGGSIANWPLVSKPVLGPVRMNDILKSSVVLIGVTPNGTVFSSVLLERSGSKTADAQALAVSRAMRFATPVGNYLAGPADNPSQLRWGRLIFHWQTVAVDQTNSANAP